MAVPNDELASTLEKAAKALRSPAAGIAEGRFDDWTKRGRIPTYPGPDDDEAPELGPDGKPKPKAPPVSTADAERDRLENEQAARYQDEWRTLKKRAEADALRIARLVEIGNPPRPKAAPDNMQGCELCTEAGLKKDGKVIPYEHTSNVGERLHRDKRLCTPHYDYIRKHDVEPSKDQTRHWWSHGTWKVPVHA